MGRKEFDPDELEQAEKRSFEFNPDEEVSEEEAIDELRRRVAASSRKEKIKKLKKQIRTGNFEMTEKEKVEWDRLKTEAQKAQEDYNKATEALTTDPETKEFEQLTNDLSEKKDSLSKFGLFHKKEKRELVSQIKAMSDRVNYLNDKVVAKKNETVKLHKKAKSTRKRYEDYSDNISKSKKLTAENELKLLDPQIGDELLFGRYPQGVDGQIHPLCWIVIARDDDQVLFLSKYVLESKTFSQEFISNAYKISDLREWLNNDFCNTAFRQDEYEKICNTAFRLVDYEKPLTNKYINDYNYSYLILYDRVFCLSVEEVEKYLPTESDRKCSSTEYALGYKPDFPQTSNYWLRTDGVKKGKAAYVSFSGQIDIYGFDVNYSVGCRPALWIDLVNWW